MSRDDAHRERRNDKREKGERGREDRGPSSPREYKDRDRDRDPDKPPIRAERDRSSTTIHRKDDDDNPREHKERGDRDKDRDRDDPRRSERGERERDDRDRRDRDRELVGSGRRESSKTSSRELEKALKEATARENRVRSQLKAERAERAELEERLEDAMARIESLTEKLRRARDLIAQSAGSTSRDEVTRAQLSELQRRNEELQRENAELKERATSAEEMGAAQLGRALKAETKLREAEANNARMRNHSSASGNGSRLGDKEKPLPPLPPIPSGSLTPDSSPSTPLTLSVNSPISSNSTPASSSSHVIPSADTGARHVVPRCGPYAASEEGRAEATEMLLHLTLAPSFALSDALLSCTAATESDRVVRALLSVYWARERALALVLHVVRSEVDATPAENYSTFLRANSFATKVGVAFLRRAAMPWIGAALRGPLDQLVKNPMPVEVDSHKEGMTTALIASNAKNLRVLTKSFLDSLYNVMESTPPCVTAVASTLRDCVERKFPGKGTTALGAFFFLRIICPAICAPEAWGLIAPDKLQPDHRRALVLVTKVLQSMANEVELGKKEDYMSIMNDFLLAQQPGLAGFLNFLAQPAPRAMPDAPRELTDDDLWTAVYDLHTQLLSVQAKVAATLDAEVDVAALDLALDKLAQPIRPTNYKRA